MHQLEIGRIRARWAAGLMKATEAAAIRSADVVALMSPANVAFFRRYFPGVNARTVVVPPWSSSGDEPVGAAHPDGDRLRVMFGGQLVRGRGVETIVDAAALLREDPIDILIAGDGPEREGLEHRAAGIDGIEFLGMLARADYRALLRTVDVGVAVTVGGVSVPSFPSKIVEYCGLGVPVVVAVEPTSDAGAMVESRGAGLVIPVDDAPALASALRALRSEQVDGALARRARSARKLYDDELSADAAATRLVESSLDGAGLPGALPR
ncbi:glycosyltransferase [Cellulomonas humilata]|uniref:Glycosyltransferase involved in cell wall biosynthesis n=1 Tax=Cellulomonas humilata TaxID=144055 RepID=A0ABU0EG71_9CELL|nr:glycosyltransferase [Cellulomonas humilata]MDQ0374229.1 glycosyltransferase involved in cell wall biosynthesis [Cellulomonas humilata]